jgi:predicted DNA-binding protein (MmcQ/YjbR family)
MNIEEYRDYCLNKAGVTESFPFGKLSNVLVFKVTGKMFTATDITTFASFSVKCNPESIEELREKYDAVKIPGYLSKKHWNRIVMDNSIPNTLLYQWIDDSYRLVVDKLPKATRTKLALINHSSTDPANHF